VYMVRSDLLTRLSKREFNFWSLCSGSSTVVFNGCSCGKGTGKFAVLLWKERVDIKLFFIVNNYELRLLGHSMRLNGFEDLKMIDWPLK